MSASKAKQGNEETMVRLFIELCERSPEAPLVYYKDNGIYKSFSRREMLEKVRALGKYLIKSGVKKGDRVGLFAFNCYEWWIADMAILSVGAVNVPIYPTNSAEECHYIIKNSGLKLCFTGDSSQKDKILSVMPKLPSLKNIIVFSDVDAKRNVPAFSKVLSDGAKIKSNEDLDKRISGLKGKDISSIIYTSGTTGHPKGVVLSHGNFYSDATQVSKVFRNIINDKDLFMSFLPLSHALERTAAYYAVITLGSRVAFADSIKTIIDDMKMISPSVINSVPRLYEKIHSGIETRISSYSFIKKAVVLLALRSGKGCIPFICSGRQPGGIRKILHSIADRAVLSKIRNEIGMSNVKVAISGGAALASSDLEFFLSLGFNVYEGYGLTECAPILTVNLPGKIKPGTVGPAMCDTEIRLSDEGEILAKGPQIMKEYYKNAAATKEAFDKNNYFKTGDLGMLDSDGYLHITGRIKDIIVTAGGKNISPQNIENSLKKSRYVEQVAVIGDKRKYLSALIIVDMAELGKFARKNEISGEGKTLLKNEKVIALLEDEVAKNLSGFARVEQIRKFTLLCDEWTQGSGELTGTLKIKRRVVEEKYKDVIDSMYREP